MDMEKFCTCIMEIVYSINKLWQASNEAAPTFLLHLHASDFTTVEDLDCHLVSSAYMLGDFHLPE